MRDLYAVMLAGLMIASAAVYASSDVGDTSMGVVSQNSKSVGTTASLLIDRNNARERLIIQNTSGLSAVRLKFGSTFSQTGSQGLQEGFSAAAGYILDLPIKDAVYAKSSGDSTILNVYELIK